MAIFVNSPIYSSIGIILSTFATTMDKFVPHKIDAKSQSFRVGSFEATTRNKILFDLRTQYLYIADKWEAEERNWSPVFGVGFPFDVNRIHKLITS